MKYFFHISYYSSQNENIAFFPRTLLLSLPLAHPRWQVARVDKFEAKTRDKT